jgi:simple sugar transport system ATP-binding protein
MLLTTNHISKTFPGVRALDDVSFDLRAGEVHALVGENGAGKSTLIKILTGALTPDDGTITLDDEPIRLTSPLDAQRKSISAVYQEIDFIPYLSLAENIWLGRETRRLFMINRRAAARRARDAMARIGIDADLARPANQSPIAIQQMAAIARAIDTNAKVLVLDEPTSSLDAAETRRLFDVVRTLTKQNLGVIFITHFLDQVFDLADRVTVLRNGRHVATHDTKAITRLRLVADMLGRSEADARALEQRREQPIRDVTHDVALSARDLKRARIGPVDIDMRTGEILGLAGILGSGRTEIARLLAGADRATHGIIETKAHKGRWHSPRHAVNAGVGLIPEDRRADAIIPTLSVRENVILARQAKRGFWRRISTREQRQTVDTYVTSLAIATRSAETPIANLSGGNQQKVILARWLAALPVILLLDEPTRGVDVGARADIERLIEDTCRMGIAVLLISSELDEVVRTSHRILVLRDGRLVGELTGDERTIDNIMSSIAEPAHG